MHQMTKLCSSRSRVSQELKDKLADLYVEEYDQASPRLVVRDKKGHSLRIQKRRAN